MGLFFLFPPLQAHLRSSPQKSLPLPRRERPPVRACTHTVFPAHLHVRVDLLSSFYFTSLSASPLSGESGPTVLFYICITILVLDLSTPIHTINDRMGKDSLGVHASMAPLHSSCLHICAPPGISSSTHKADSHHPRQM